MDLPLCELGTRRKPASHKPIASTTGIIQLTTKALLGTYLCAEVHVPQLAAGHVPRLLSTSLLEVLT